MFSSVTSSVTGWFGGIKPEDTSPEGQQQTDSQTVTDSEPTGTGTATGAQSQAKEATAADTGQTEAAQAGAEKPQPAEGDQSQLDLDEVSAKALTAAKEWGSYLFSVGKTATEQVAKTAKQFKETVEENTILGDFSKEQNKFVSEQKEQKQKTEAAVAPWVGYNEEDTMKSQILALSADQRNFLRNPPSGVQFQFDAVASHPVAMAMLQEDPNLEKMRFLLVPKQVKEDIFWRNYFYRVSLIKQSAQLTSLAQQTGNTGEISSSVKGDSSVLSSQQAGKEEDKEPDELPPASPPDHEFISDSFQHSQLDEDDIKQGMEQLGMNNQPPTLSTQAVAADDDIPEWERELQAELQEYEVVADDGVDADLEQEILQQIEAEAEQS